MVSIRRRVARLAQSGCFHVKRDYPPLTVAEIEELADQAQGGERITDEEVDRVRSQSPICCGEILMHAYKGSFSCKRYIGIDVSSI
jgi:hypothetical protein